MNRHRLFSIAFGLVSFGATLALAEDTVTYGCQGFDEPLNRSQINIGRGRVLPLRAKLVLPDGSFADRKSVKTTPMLTLKYQPEGGAEVDKTSGIEVRDFGKANHFVWDDEAHWKFDLGTGNLPDNGKYVVTFVSGDEKEYRVDPPCSLVFILTGGPAGKGER
jgi:hypothetical protein